MPNTQLEPWRVLLVDDDRDDYQLTHSMLRKAQARKIELDWAPSFQIGQKLLKSKHYHAVLIDYDLGPRNGIELIRAMSSQEYSAPLILFTGRGSLDVDMEAMDAGATLYLTKEEATPLLLERFIRYAIERKQAEEQLRASEARKSFLLELRDRLSELTGDQAIAAAAGELLGRRLNAGRVVYSEIDPAGEYATVWACWTDGSMPGIKGRYRLDDFGIGDLYRSGLIRQTDDIRIDLQGSQAGEHEALQIRASIGVPVFKGGRLVAVMAVHSTAPRGWTDAEVELVRDVGERAWLEIERARAETALRESEERFRSALEIETVGVIFFKTGGSITDANDAFLRMSGYSRQDLEKGLLRWDVLTPAEWMPHSLRAVEEFKATGHTAPYEKEYIRKDGSRWWALFAAARLAEDEGVEYVIDITQNKQAEEAIRISNERYLTLFDSIDEGFCIIEMLFDEAGKPSDYRFLEINQAFEQQTGLTQAQGKRMRQLAPQHEAYWFEIYGQVALTGQPVRFENHAKELNRWYSVYAFRVGQPEERKVGILFTDITDRLRTERELQAYMEELTRSNQALHDFAFMASHDLHEPLRKIRAFSEQLVTHSSRRLDEQGRDYINRIQQATERMQSMLDGLLAYSKVNTQEKAFEESDLNRLAAEVLSDLELRLKLTGGSVELGELPVIQADPLQMRQLLQNLIGNAIKFHKPGVPPCVKVSGKPAQNGYIELIVEDNGIGFDMSSAGKLFKPFHRLVGKSAYEGSGIGLAICQKIAERHGGSIVASSEPGVGSTFTVTLPRMPEA